MLNFYFIYSFIFFVIFILITNSNEKYCKDYYPIIIIGSGLAGHVSGYQTLIELKKLNLNGKYKIIILEKESKFGGNSMKATSGINGCNTKLQKNNGINDDIKLFNKDTTKSASNNNDLINTLCVNSGNAVNWLYETFNLNLNKITQCGGHSKPRTHRFESGPVGNIIVKTIHKEIQNEVEFIYNANVKDLIFDDETKGVIGVKYMDKDNKLIELYGSSVILTMGGYGNDHDKQNSLLDKYALNGENKLPTTNGNWATGDGIKIAANNGIQLIDMSYIQVHPTGFINPKDPDNNTKFLAPEALRGTGGIIINNKGQRFVNELDTRKNIVNIMNSQNNNTPFRLLLNDKIAQEFGPNINFYIKFGLITKYENIQALSNDINIDINTLTQTINEYSSLTNMDSFGKRIFPNNKFFDINNNIYSAIITPVIHYTMGGIKINNNTNVFDINDDIIPGLFAAGEVTGGVHGKNRLAGNSLLECVVYGRIAAKNAVNFCQKYNDNNKNEL